MGYDGILKELRGSVVLAAIQTLGVQAQELLMRTLGHVYREFPLYGSLSEALDPY